MTDFSTDLKERFDFAAHVRLEAYKVLPDGKTIERSLEDECFIDVFEELRDSVDVVPPELVNAAEQLRNAAPELFEKWLVHGVQVIGPNFMPNNATEFVNALNSTGQRDMTPA